jgi:hypothetical protein
VLERPLIDHLVWCEQHLELVQQFYTRTMAESITLTKGMYWERRLTLVQTRYLRAVETLAKIRRVRVEALAVEQSDGTRAAGVAIEQPGR